MSVDAVLAEELIVAVAAAAFRLISVVAGRADGQDVAEAHGAEVQTRQVELVALGALEWTRLLETLCAHRMGTWEHLREAAVAVETRRARQETGADP